MENEIEVIDEPGTKTFVEAFYIRGKRGKRPGERTRVWLNDKELWIEDSWKIRRHSNEFNWGYEGSGPFQLALAICTELYGKFGVMIYQEFKREVIAKIQGDEFDICIKLEHETKIRIVG
jgi:hypothetical protein